MASGGLVTVVWFPLEGCLVAGPSWQSALGGTHCVHTVAEPACLGEPCEPVLGAWAEVVPLTPRLRTHQDPRGEDTGAVHIPS